MTRDSRAFVAACLLLLAWWLVGGWYAVTYLGPLVG